VGKGLGGTLICYLDTQAAICLAEAHLEKLSHKALSHIERCDVRISPMVVVELAYLFEIHRTILKPAEIVYVHAASLPGTRNAWPIVANRRRRLPILSSPPLRLVIARFALLSIERSLCVALGE
jgi:hypothetical protein